MTITHVDILHPGVQGLLRRLSHILTGLASDVAKGRDHGQAKLNASQQVSILVTDIVGFSELMATWPLEMVVANLNCYFERLSRCVYRHRGQIDKFVGDGMVAVFQSADDAVYAARAIQSEVTDYNSRGATGSGPVFPTRIVVDSGQAVITSLGLGRDRSATVMGPVVNAASHLAKTLPPGKVFISHNTCCRMRNRGRLWLTVAQAADRNGCRQVVYEVPAPDSIDTPD